MIVNKTERLSITILVLCLRLIRIPEGNEATMSTAFHPERSVVLLERLLSLKFLVDFENPFRSGEIFDYQMTQQLADRTVAVGIVGLSSTKFGGRIQR